MAHRDREPRSSLPYFQAIVRILAVGLLSASLGLVIYCDQNGHRYDWGYAFVRAICPPILYRPLANSTETTMQTTILLFWNLVLLVRFGLILFGKAPAASYNEVAWYTLCDLLGCGAGFIGGAILILLGLRWERQCGSLNAGECAAEWGREDAANMKRMTAAALLMSAG
jgi:hypothetical protein